MPTPAHPTRSRTVDTVGTNPPGRPAEARDAVVSRQPRRASLRGLRHRYLVLGWLTILLARDATAGDKLAAPLAAPSPIGEQIRRPIAILPIAGGQQLAILNRRSGTISRVDARARTVYDECRVAHRLAAGCWLADGTLALLDEQTCELMVWSLEADGWRFRARHPVAAAPANVLALPDGRGCLVASTWARRLTFFSWSADGGDTLQAVHTLDLPFAPRQLLGLDEHRVLVADAFGGWLAVVDTRHSMVLRARELQATHNITGLAQTSDRSRVYLTHQMLSGDQATTQPNVHWGDIMSNVVRRMDLAWFLSEEPEQTTAADLYYLGHPDSAAGDPSGILITNSARFIVGLGGVNQVAVSDRGLNHFQRLTVGRRPIALWLDAEHSELLVANYFDDTLSVIDLARARVVETISLGLPGVISLADRGEQLFYDARLSSDGWYSCHSCHTDGHTNGQRSDTFGDGYRGDPKQVLSLLGTSETGPWAWNGTIPMLEAQIRKSIETTMQGVPPEPEDVQALAAHLMTLSPPPSVRQARGEAHSIAVEQGRAVFQEAGCADCHQPPTYTSANTYDVGLGDPDGQQEFNPPSLLGVGHRRRLLHDGRAEDLRAALRIHPSGHGLELDEDHWVVLQEFLLSL